LPDAGETAELVAQQQDRRTAATQERVRHLLTLTGEERDLERYFDLAGCQGERARALAPHDASAQIGWYVLRKPGF
jgi:hypothetical protein